MNHSFIATGATLGVCNLLNKLILNSLLKGEQPRVAMVFDSKDGTNFRKILYPDYKANRQACPEDLVPQFEFVKEAADAYGILTMEAAGYEADDVIATIATRAMEEGTHVNILSGDKDLMQLVTIDDGGACIELIDPMKMVRFSHEKVIQQWGVEPSQLADVLALAGDSSDNIPGVPGIGPKIAASLIQEYGTLEGVLDNIDGIKQKARKQKIKENVQNAILSRQLVELERNIPSESITFSSQFDRVSDFRTQPLQIERLLKFYDLMGFKDLKARVKSRLPIIGTNDGRYNDILDKKAGGKSRKNIDRNETYRRPPSESDFTDVPF
jgi:DNA polymerase-1